MKKRFITGIILFAATLPFLIYFMTSIYSGKLATDEPSTVLMLVLCLFGQSLSLGLIAASFDINENAKLSFILSLFFWVWLFNIFFSFAAFFFGLKALSQIRNTGQKGRLVAMASIVISMFPLFFGVVFFLRDSFSIPFSFTFAIILSVIMVFIYIFLFLVLRLKHYI